MLAILNSLNARYLSIIQPILMIVLVSKLVVHRVLSDKTYLSLGLLSVLRFTGKTRITGKTGNSSLSGKSRHPRLTGCASFFFLSFFRYWFAHT